MEAGLSDKDMGMRYRRFGKSGWQVSQLSLGTVELGVKYGIYKSGEFTRPSKKEAIQLLLHAFEQGVNLIDTAPAYGTSETLIGAALKEWQGEVYIATKVGKVGDNGTPPSQDVKKSIFKSIAGSLKHLKRDYLDLVQIHNPTTSDLRNGEILDALLEAQHQGMVQHIGVSVYETDTALEALRHPEFVSLQVAYNLLDHRMFAKVFPKAEECDVAILTRSALLKGVLTERYRLLPAHFVKLKQAAEKAQTWADLLGDTLPNAAIRFCLSSEQVASVLVGVRSRDELRSNLDAVNKPLIDGMQLQSAGELAVDDEALVDPRTWGMN